MSTKTTTGTVGALVLAAGYSRRFGDIKLQARLRSGSSVFEQTLARIAAATPHLCVVTRDDLLEVRQATAKITGDQRQAALCPDAQLGMGHTLAFGIAQISNWDACLVCLGDMPFISTRTYGQLLDSLRSDLIILPQFEGQTGNPVGFGSDFFSALRVLRGDTGGRDVLRTHRERIQHVPVNDAAILLDIDTPEDLARHDTF